MVAVIIAAALAAFGHTAAASRAPSPRQGEADALVQELRELPAPWPFATAPSDGVPRPLEVLQDRLYEQLRQLGDTAWPALSQGLSDPDVRVRRSVLIYLNSLGVAFPSGPPKTDFQPCLPALIGALRDDDQYVRYWSAQMIALLGSKAASAVPALIARLSEPDDPARRDVLLALGQIGAAASAALPAVRNMLADPNADMRRFAQLAIDKIQGSR